MAGKHLYCSAIIGDGREAFVMQYGHRHAEAANTEIQGPVHAVH